MDFAYYGNTVSSPKALVVISPSDSLIWHVLMQLAIFAIAAGNRAISSPPGSWTAWDARRSRTSAF